MCGVQIWSVKEGQQRFESHADKLINYIRYWQASGESLKTSARIKTRMEQLASEGVFCGGVCPYGYRLVKTGRKNNRGYEVHDLEIVPDEAKVIRQIYDYHIRYGYGTRKISSELAAYGILDRKGEVFHPSSIKAILHRELVTGAICRGNGRSAVNPELQIITPDIYQRAQQITAMRNAKKIPPKIAGKALLSGNIYCGHCGGRIFASTAKKSHHPTAGEDTRIPIYKCYNRVQYRDRCTGQTCYRAQRIDAVVMLRMEQFSQEGDDRSALFTAFQSAERPVQKMIAGQWISRVTVFSYDHIEVSFQDYVLDPDCRELE